MKSEADLPFVSIVIINYNGMRFLKDCLESVLRTDYPREKLEIIIVDNASTDNSVNYIQKHFPEVKLVKLSRNLGFGYGANIGASKSRGDLIAFLNNDVIVDKRWLRELVNVIIKNRDAAIVGSRVLGFYPCKKMREYIKIPILHILGGMTEVSIETEESKKDFIYVGTIYGAAFLIKRSVFEELGGFDPTYFMYSDEVDLCMRALLRGYMVAYCLRSIVYHFGSGTAGRTLDTNKDPLYTRISSPLRAYFGNRNSLFNIVKNLSTKNMLVGLVLSGVYSIMLIVLSPSRYESKLLLYSWISFFKKMKKFLIKRFYIQSSRIRSDEWLIKNRLLISFNELLKIFINQMRSYNHF